MKCNLCKSEKGRVLYKFSDYPDVRGGAVIRCRNCGLVYRYWPNEKGSEKWEQGPLNPMADYPSKFDEKRRKIFSRIIDEIESFRETNRILDVGSGEGHFLKLCFEKKWRAYGVEVKSDLLEGCKKVDGINVSRGSFEELNFQENFFDVVTFINVLEHMEDPWGALKKAHQIIRPGGGILIRSPNGALHVRGRQIVRKVYRIAKSAKHFDTFTISRYAFDRNSILSYLRRSGFVKCTVDGDNSWSFRKKSETSSLRTLCNSAAMKMAEWLYAFSTGMWLIAPSLLAKGTKLEVRY
jgi:2-polyprenyl-3-methyl-5-hydroxy-6-metoxy-1,4-benzoquinol methylase